MTKREIYFVRNNQLYKRTVEVTWDKDSMEVNKKICSEELFNAALPFMQPCVDVSSSSGIYNCRNLSPYCVKDENGNSVHDMWDILSKHKDRKFLPPGSFDLVYLKSLTEEQFIYAMSKNSFYDIYFNSKTKETCSAKALAVLKLLYGQNKLDYILDMNKFLHWYWVNGSCPMEWTKYYEISEENRDVSEDRKCS